MIWRNGVLEVGEGGSDPRSMSYGAFTTAGCDNGRPLLWDRHRRRLAATLEELDPGLQLVLPTADEMAGLLSAEGLSGPARLRLVARFTDSAWNLEACVTGEEETGPDRQPLQLDVVYWPAAPPLAGHKTLARLAWDLAAVRARAQGADDAVLVDSAGQVLETSVANVWARSAARMMTPRAPTCCLPGIMRGWLSENLCRAGLVVEEVDLSLEQLLDADEIWVSNAVVGVRRVQRIGAATWSTWQAFSEITKLGVPAPGWPTVPAKLAPP